MRLDIIEYSHDHELDIGFKFVDSYLEAAKLIRQFKFDPFDHLILDKKVNNKKSKDLKEFVQNFIEKDLNFLINYNQELKELELIH